MVNSYPKTHSFKDMNNIYFTTVNSELSLFSGYLTYSRYFNCHLIPWPYRFRHNSLGHIFFWYKIFFFAALE